MWADRSRSRDEVIDVVAQRPPQHAAGRSSAGAWSPPDHSAVPTARACDIQDGVSSTPALRHVFVGGYTAEPDGHAIGVSSLLNERSGRARPSRAGLDHGPRLADLADPPSQLPVLLLADRGDQPRQRQQPALRRPTGPSPCCPPSRPAATAPATCRHPDGDYAIVSSYRSGVVVGVRRSPTTARCRRSSDSMQFAGSGPVSDRQEGPHAHQVVVDGDEMLCLRPRWRPDLPAAARRARVLVPTGRPDPAARRLRTSAPGRSPTTTWSWPAS